MTTSINICNNSKDYYFNFIQNENDINDENIFKNYDINFLNIFSLPVNYYPIYNTNKLNEIIDNIKNNISLNPTPIINKIKTEINDNIEYMKNNNLIYNTYNITLITIFILIIWIFLLLFILKYIHFYYNIYYIYFISTIIILLLFFGSFWFLYVNSELI